MKCYTGKTAPIEMIGRKFGHLLVVSELERNKNNHRMFLCKCSCGRTKEILGSSLRSGSTKSCCYLDKKIHGMWEEREFKIWSSMKQRCYNEKTQRWDLYGGRGISVCEQWKNSFQIFFKDMGPSNGLTLDRIDVNGNYEPSNCRWATPKTQQRNRTVNKIITYNGQSLCVSEWCEKIKMPTSTFYNRLKRNWSIDRIINDPIRNIGNKFVKEADL